MTDAHPATACPNCDSALAGIAPTPRFCPQCGQETTLHPPSVGEFLHEFVGHYVALEGALWKTLGLLLFRPGRLTTEYVAGRRRRYVLPLRLYLSASFLFFLMVKLLPLVAASAPAPAPGAHAVIASRAATAPAAASGAGAPVIEASGAAAQALALAQVRQALGSDRAGAGWLARRVGRRLDQFQRDGRSTSEALVHEAQSAAPYAVFLMLPVFAGIVALAYRNRRAAFGEHVVFAMHMHAFWFLAALAAALLPDAAGDPLLLAVAAYGLLALRQVYGGRWAPTALRALAISALYGVAVMAATVAIVAGVVLG